MKKFDVAYLAILVEVTDNQSAVDVVGNWLQALPPQYAGRLSHKFVGMSLTSHPPGEEEHDHLVTRELPWFRAGNDHIKH